MNLRSMLCGRMITIIVTTLTLLLLSDTVQAQTFPLSNLFHLQQSNIDRCLAQAADGSTGRTLVLVDGIDTEANDLAAMRPRWESLLSYVSKFYSHVVYFSYNSDDLESYTKEDTYRSIYNHSTKLLDQRINACADQGYSSFDIVGYSLGGTVASEYIKFYGFRYPGRVKHVITLDSPVNGINVALSNAAVNPLSSGIVGSQAAQDLAGIYFSGDTTISMNELSVRRLLSRGTEVWTLTNSDDVFIGPHRALIPVLNRSFSLGRKKLTLDLGERVGHIQITQMEKYPQVGETIYNILYSIPNSAKVVEASAIPVLKPGERVAITRTVYNASIMPWPAQRTNFHLISGQSFDLRRSIPFPREVPAAAPVELHLSITAPVFPGVYESIWKVAIGDVPFENEIPVAVVVIPPGSEAGLREQIQALIATAREDLNKRVAETWEDLKRQIIERIQEEIAREIRRVIVSLCGTGPAALAFVACKVWWRRRRCR